MSAPILPEPWVFCILQADGSKLYVHRELLAETVEAFKAGGIFIKLVPLYSLEQLKIKPVQTNPETNPELTI